jgi:chaperonin GroEL
MEEINKNVIIKETDTNSIIDKNTIYNIAKDILTPVIASIGPHGSLTSIQHFRGNEFKFTLTKDGITILKSNKYYTANYRFVHKVLIEAADNTVNNVGDGTSSTLLFIELLLAELVRLSQAVNSSELGITVKSIVDRLHISEPSILNYLTSMAKPVTLDSIYDIAMIASNGDEEMSNHIAAIINTYGFEPYIDVIESDLKSTHITTYKGIVYDDVELSSYFLKSNRLEAENAKIIIIDKKLHTLEPYITLLDRAIQNNETLIVMALGFEDNVMNIFIENSTRGSKIIPVKIPGLATERNDNIANIIALTDAPYISDTIGTVIENIKYEDLGLIKNFKIVADKMIIEPVGTDNITNNIQKRINFILSEINAIKVDSNIHSSDKEYKIAKLTKYKSMLASGNVKILVGSDTPSNTKELKDRYDDAISACINAKHGVVTGAGAIYEQLANRLNSDTYLNIDFIIMSAVSRAISKLGDTLYNKAFPNAKTNTDLPLGIEIPNNVIEPLLISHNVISNGFTAVTILLKTNYIISDDVYYI